MSQQINLFSPVFLKQKKTFSALNMVEALGLLVLGVVVFYGYASHETTNLTQEAEEASRQLNQSKVRLAQTSARYAPKKVDPALEVEVANLQSQLSARKTALNSLAVGLLPRDSGYAESMRALARQSLPGLWLTGFKLSRGGAEIEIVGRALQPDLVPTYIRGLNRERALQGRAMESLVMTQRQAALPADAKRPAGAPANYTYTEFRLGSRHGELPAPAEAELAPAASAAQGAARDLLPAQLQSGSAAAK